MIHQVEILEDILSRLPAKSIGRFRCVSKPWRSLLSQPHFIKTHLNRTKQLPIEEQSVLFISHETDSLYSMPLKSAPQASDETMSTALFTRLILGNHRFPRCSIDEHVTSCDGLVLVTGLYERLLLVNPTTREFKELPPTPCDLKPDAYSTLYGLGYDSFTDDYKVLSLSYYYSECFEYYCGQVSSDSEDSEHEYTDTSVCVYSVKNGTWKRVDSSPFYHDVKHNSPGVYVDGYIHMVACECPDGSHVIGAFDLEAEEFVEVPLPLSDCGMSVWGRLAMLDGYLCMWPSWSKCQTIFAMKDDDNGNESWTKFAAVKYEDHENSDIRPLCSLGKEQIVLLIDGDSGDEKLAIYDSGNGTHRDILIQGIPNDFWVKGTFIESLVSPHCIRSAAINEAE